MNIEKCSKVSLNTAKMIIIEIINSNKFVINIELANLSLLLY